MTTGNAGADVLSSPPPGGDSPPPSPPAPSGDDEAGVWYGKIDGLDDETKGWLGEHGKYEGPASALKALMSAQRLIGGDKLAAPREDEDISKWDGWDKLGALKSAEEYATTLKRPQMPAGVDYDGEAEKQLVDMAVKQRWPKHITQQVLDLGTHMRLATIDAIAQQTQEERAAYGTEAAQAWGSKKKDQEELARRAARFIGMEPDAAQELGEAAGSFKMVAALAKLGAALAEDGTLIGDSRGNSLGLTADQAQAEIKAQNDDAEVAKALQDEAHPRHREVTERRRELQKIAYAGRE
jgi:hypothetical protein